MTTETLEEIVIDEKIEDIIHEPFRYHVVFLNDDKTPMEFVVEILKIIFKHSQQTAEQIMLEVHEKGSSIAGTYSFEIAEQKTAEATLCARKQGFPLGIQLEKA